MNSKFILGILLLFTQKNLAAIRPEQPFQPKNPDLRIAVIDTGADTEHKDLKGFIWVNEGETGKDAQGRDKATNKIDDDGNGFVDDIHGWNFVNDTNDVSDSQGHGTHIAGIIAKEFVNHHTGSTSAPAARLMILKYYDPSASDEKNVISTVRAIQYATKMRARIINYSGGGTSSYRQEFQAIEKAAQAGILLIAAAGNNNSNTDVEKYFPANYNLKNIISVAATDKDGDLVPFSNYGPNSVDIAAPGKTVYSTLPHNCYGFMSGTSQATAFVTGVAASLLANGSGTGLTLLAELLSVSRFNRTLKGKTKFQMAMIR